MSKNFMAVLAWPTEFTTHVGTSSQGVNERVI